ncbi:MAG: hypothetical protein LBH51_01245 [Treponema sp.]|jgi:hypothetical protein|nr:hypothetical protein [Treponema sp.]
MDKKTFVGLVLAFGLAASSAFAEGDISLSLEFNASILSIDSEGVVDSMTDVGFNEDETSIDLSYEDDSWGVVSSLAFGNENLRFMNGGIESILGMKGIGDISLIDGFPLSLSELYGWVKPFGDIVKFTGGVFENTDGIADYTDDIDDFQMGVFFSDEPEEITNTALVNGLLTDLVFGPVTLQFLLAPNYSKETATDLISEAVPNVDVPARLFRLGGRAIVDVGVGTLAAMFKTFQLPAISLLGADPSATKENYNTFGAYFDFTAVENLGLSLGYTGFLPTTDAEDAESVLYSGIDLRATWTGIEGLSISTHNNITFAAGAEKDWMRQLGKDDTFLSLYNAIGATKELNDKFSVKAGVGNLLQIYDFGGDKFQTDGLGLSANLIVKVTDNAEFNVGARVDINNITTTGILGDTDETLTVFSIPVGIVVSF